MKNTFTSWIRVAPAVLGCMMVVATASAQDNAPLAENGMTPGVQEFAQPQLLNPDVFYNYYPNTYAGATSAQMYVAPLPVPANVGHTYYTYQPLMPHEYMYGHRRVYYTPYGANAFYGGNRQNCYDGYGSGMNKTTVNWYHGAFHLNHPPISFGGRAWKGFRGNGSCNTCR